MELREFISQALIDIVGGVSDAQAKLPEGQIVPKVASNFKAVDAGVHHLQSVSFEVNVNVEESKGKGAKIGVISTIIGAGMESKSSEGSGHSTRLSFKVPISFKRPE